MRVARTAANIGVIVAALAAWSACSSSSTGVQHEQPDAAPASNPECSSMLLMVDPNMCCPANCFDGETCDLQVFEASELNTCENGSWVQTGYQDQFEDSGPTSRPDASTPDATQPGADGSAVDAAGDADVTADAPADVADDAPTD